MVLTVTYSKIDTKHPIEDDKYVFVSEVREAVIEADWKHEDHELKVEVKR